jgi:hypothetical protein
MIKLTAGKIKYFKDMVIMNIVEDEKKNGLQRWDGVEGRV